MISIAIAATLEPEGPDATERDVDIPLQARISPRTSIGEQSRSGIDMAKITLIAAAAAALALSGTAALAAGDPVEGEKAFKRSCGACHVAVKDGPKRLGPPLFGLVGRKAGSVEGFRYSEANKNSGVTWTPQILDQYLTDPKKFMPGTNMAFAGLKKDDERANVVSYLETLK
jgi:cytochrome c